MTRLVITQRPTWKVRLAQGGAAVAVVLSCWVLFEYGRYRAGFDGISAQMERLSHLGKVHELEQTIGDLREQKAILERATQIDSEAYKQLDGELGGLRDEILELNKELAFYRGIVTNQGDSGSLQLQRFDIEPSGANHTFRYQLVLTQVLTSSGPTNGSATFTIEGVAGQSSKTLSMAEVTGGRSKELSFRFKYFQELSGEVTLPAGFTPKRVVVSVNPRGADTLQKSYNWPS